MSLPNKISTKFPRTSWHDRHLLPLIYIYIYIYVQFILVPIPTRLGGNGEPFVLRAGEAIRCCDQGEIWQISKSS